MSTSDDFDYAAAWQALPEGLRNGAVTALRDALDPLTKQAIREAIAADPEDWVLPYHSNWGMWARNLLREKVCSDAALPAGTAGPHGNWDDYYPQAVQAAVAA